METTTSTAVRMMAVTQGERRARTRRVPSLLTTANPKTLKGEARGYFTAVLHLAPATAAGGATLCTCSSPGCELVCLNTAGRGGIGLDPLDPATTNAIQQARIRRTLHFRLDRAGFVAQLLRDIDKHIARARRLGLVPCVRVNGTSDQAGLAREIADARPDLVCYDYTKLPRPWERERANYTLTFSRHELNEAQCRDALAHGVNVAVCFDTRKGQPLPATYWGRPVLDGDASDLRFLDPRSAGGYIIGLRAKGRAIYDTTGFTVRLNGPAPVRKTKRVATKRAA